MTNQSEPNDNPHSSNQKVMIKRTDQRRVAERRQSQEAVVSDTRSAINRRMNLERRQVVMPADEDIGA